MLFSILVLGAFLRYSMDSTVTALLRRDVAIDSGNIAALLQSRIANVNAAAGILSSNPEIIGALREGTSESLILMDSRAVVVRDRFELDILQIYDANNVARTNIVQSSLYRVSSVINIVPPGHSDLYLIDDRLVFLSRKDVKGGGVVIVGIDILSELERLAHELNLRDTVMLREGVLPDNPTRYTTNDFSLDSLIPIGTKTIVFTITRNTEQFYAVAQTAQNVLMISMSFIAVLLVLTAIFVARSVTAPIHGLSIAAREIASADFNKPFKPRSFFDKEHNPFKIGFGDEIGQLAESFTHMEKELHGVYTGLINDLQKANKNINDAYDATLLGWSSALELRDHETGKHTSRVAAQAQELARFIGLSEK